MGVSSAKHRRRRPIRDFAGACLQALLLWYNRRRLRRPTPAAVQDVAASMARLPWTAERIPLRVSWGEHLQGVRTIEAYQPGRPPR